MEQIPASDDWPPTGWVDQGQWLGGFKPDDIATTAVQIAEACLGLGPSVHSGLEVYEQVLFPASIDPQIMRDSIPQMSCCALLGRAVLRALGVVHKLLDEQYQLGLATRDLVQVARDHGAWLDSDTVPQRGDIVLIGSDPPTAEWGSPGHVLIATEVSTSFVHSIDGGRGNVHRTVRRIACYDNCTIWLDYRRIYGLVRTADIGVGIGRTWCLPRIVVT